MKKNQFAVVWALFILLGLNIITSSTDVYAQNQSGRSSMQVTFDVVENKEDPKEDPGTGHGPGEDPNTGNTHGSQTVGNRPTGQNQASSNQKNLPQTNMTPNRLWVVVGSICIGSFIWLVTKKNKQKKCNQ